MKKILLLSCLLGVAGAEEHQHAKAPTNPAFDKLKTLAGNWEGTAKDSGKGFKATTSVKLVSGGSVLMSILGEGGPEEMGTMVQLDRKELMGTAYCAAMNHARFKAAACRPNPAVVRV